MLRGKLNEYFSLLKIEEKQFLAFLKARYPLFHKSNFFYRDFQYGIRKYLEMKGIEVSYAESDQLARELGAYLEQKTIFIPVNDMGWTVNYPEYVTTVPGDPL